MESTIDSPAFHVYAAVSAALMLKLFLLAAGTGISRQLTGVRPNPEDVALLGGAVGAESDLTARWKRAHANALENELPFVLLGLLYALMGASPWAMQIYAYTFFFARVAHSIFYLMALQPFRTGSWVVGLLCLIGMCVQVLMEAFGM